MPGDLPRITQGWATSIPSCGALTLTLVGLEATGGFENPAVAALTKAAIPVVIANPRPVRDFAKALGRLAKTDALDTCSPPRRIASGSRAAS